ncbi:MAG: Asp-tRNA(Asn)/Glu-tRNA(Gln) amidotransferase subunit GatC [Oscillospiraceae bacterium]|jgi:aspartyl-tRNA(Asn)/glutamyl-tRNA(Gln) amidotransferase subunit C|nr:Asp-tRNA(Asn)/Glu-tRNA(Gln) amidotransferase subunit GatC [Oscillospiraceae bacterium]MDY4191418.1 Asp-tRNA(Asn)/Glu-tRNA(Gln) amidotransferase subunit GatC [Oscillospiraceae bacterium]
MKIDIQHIAKLARLSIPEEKAPMFERQMEEIVAMCENMPEITADFDPVDPAHPMALRRDEIAPSFSREDILRNAPQSQAGCVVVPRTVE